MTIIQTNTTEYTAYYKGYKAKAFTQWQAITALLWVLKDNGTPIHI